MFWILRRTGAVNFFNSLNNNCSTSKGNNNSTNDKYVKRPPRKAYGRLSADSDDNASITQKIDDPFDDVDNFEMIASSRGKSMAGNNNQHGTTTNGSCLHLNDEDNHENAGHNTECRRSCELGDCQGNIANGDACNLNETGLCLGGGGGGGIGVGVGDIENNGTTAQPKLKEINQNTIDRLHAMAMSDDDDYDEALTCNVCDRAFACHRQLASHQQKKRHFCCSGCDSLFPSLMLLEHHKEEFEHWSDEEISRRICCRRNRGDDYFTDTDSFTSEAESEDLERLL